jgi:Arcadin 1
LSIQNSSNNPTGPANSVKVRVYRISSVTDPDTGKPGKSIELVQVKQQRQQPYFSGGFGSGGESDLVRNIISQFQSMGLPIGPNPGGSPKLNLFLSESEYDLLGVRFEVNEVYDMILKDGAIRFSKPSEGI